MQSVEESEEPKICEYISRHFLTGEALASYKFKNSSGETVYVCADCAELEQGMGEILKLVNEQAKDEGLWFVAQTVTEEYLMAALRQLHKVIEDNAYE